MHSCLQFHAHAVDSTHSAASALTQVIAHCIQQSYAASFVVLPIQKQGTTVPRVFFSWPACFLPPWLQQPKGCCVDRQSQFSFVPRRCSKNIVACVLARALVACLARVHLRPQA